MNIVFQGMCFSGKSTLGKMVADKLNISFLDSRDLFTVKYGISESEYLRIHGNETFIDAEKKSIRRSFKNMVFSLGGSAIYYSSEMAKLNEKHIIIWLDVPYDIILKRKEREKIRGSILYPDGINSFEELYQQRVKLYPTYTDIKITISDNDEKPEVTCNRVVNEILARYRILD